MFLSILLVVILHLIPADVSTFTLDMAGNGTTRFTQQADGGWSGTALPDQDLGTFYVNGTKLTAKAEGKEHTLDLGNALNLGEATDWSNLQQFTLGDNPVQIKREANGLDFIFTEKHGDKETKRTIKVRWEQAGSE